MPGIPVPHHLPEFAQVHACSNGDTMQPSHPLSLRRGHIRPNTNWDAELASYTPLTAGFVVSIMVCVCGKLRLFHKHLGSIIWIK